MSYQVTARKWRPMVFDDVVGQTHITTTLRNAIASDRIAHAYIFSGQRGCGKTTTARILAKALNCLHRTNDFNPDNACDVCKEITDGRSLDVIEIDGASNRGVEEIRNLRESVRYTATRGKYKIYIIDEVHMLTKEAFNALLKTLEEPPPHVVFIFATTEVHKVPATILSRCQRFDFRRIGIDEITDRLRYIAKEEGIAIEDDALMVIAKKGDGSLRDSQSIFDQVRSFCGNTISTADALKTLNAVDLDVYFKVSALIQANDQRGGIGLVDEVIKSGYDLREFVSGLAEHFRNLLVVLSTGSGQLVETSDHFRAKYVSESKKWNEADLLRLLKHTNELEQSIRWASQPRYKLEAGLLQMITMQSSVKIGDLLQQIEDLKQQFAIGQGSADPGRSAGGATKAAATGRTQRGPAQGAGDVKVVGTVSAGMLHSPAVTTVPREAIMFGSKYTSPANEAGPEIMRMAAGSVPVLKTISVEEAYARWQEWVGEVRKQKISVASTLDQSKISAVANGAIRITCPDDYGASNIRRNREFLAESFKKVTGYQMLIEPEVSAEESGKVISAYTSTSTSSTASIPSSSIPHQSSPAVSSPNHPVLQALIRELGAEKVE
ncbi:MAG: DNA polymerase III subunit gamma/tau [Bacteroidota bacterium]